ncbi:MAG: O-antigen ligase family protein [Mycobacterium sp.]
MSSSLATLAIAVASGIAGLVSISAVAKTFRRGEWTSAAYLSLAMAFMSFSFVTLLVTYTDSWLTVTDVFRSRTLAPPPWAHEMLRAFLVIQTFGAIGVVIARVRRENAMVSVPSVCLLMVSLISVGVALLRGDHPIRPFTVVYVLTLLACTVAPRGIGIHLGIAVTGLLETVSSGLAVWLHHDSSTTTCVVGYKCGLLGFNLHGISDNENALAISMALAMPFIYMAFRGWQGTFLTLYVAAMVTLTGSRTGLVAAGIALLALLVVRPDARRPEPAPGRSLLLALGLILVIGIGAVVPFVVNNPDAFTGRVALWRIARTGLTQRGNLLHGTGVFGWDHVRETGQIDASEVYSVHNQWLQVVYSTGLIGLAFFVVAVALLLWQARRTYFTVIGCVLVPFAVLSITERPWTLDTADTLTWAVVGALLCYPLAPRRPAAREEPALIRDEVPAT